MTRIIRGAPLDLASARRDAYEEGLRQGREEGRAESAALLARAQAEQAAQRNSLVENALSLAVELAASLLGEIARQPEQAARLALRAKESARAEQIRVRVAPEALASTQHLLGEGCAVIADASLSPGDCLIDTEWGQLNARLSLMLPRLAQQLRPVLEESARHDDPSEAP
jgi:flagellar biosynthesis/type III secretory pathway protein FliH